MMQMSRILWSFMIGVFTTNPDDLYDPTADFIGWRLIGAPFTPRPDLVKSDLTLIDDHLVNIFLPAVPAYQRQEIPVDTSDAWFFARATTAAFLDFQPDGSVLPMTVYGYAFLGHDQDDFWFVTAFDTPKTFASTDQGFFVDTVIATFPQSMLINS